MRLPAASQTIPLAAAPPTVWVGHLIMLVVLLPFHGVGGVIVLSWCWWCYCLIMVLVVLLSYHGVGCASVSYHENGGAIVLSWCWW